MEDPLSPRSPAAILADRGTDFCLHDHEPVRTVAEIERKTSFPIQRSVKTIAFTVGGKAFILASVPGPFRLNYSALASLAGVRRAELKAADIEAIALLGMEPGGVSPVCEIPMVAVAFDTRLTSMGRVFCGSGRAHQTIEVEAQDLVRAIETPLIGDIAKA